MGEQPTAEDVPKWHRRAIGTENNRALVDVLLARTHALLGNDYTGRESEPWELAFAEAAKANAAAAGGRHAEHATHYARADEIAKRLDAENRKIFMATFERIPVPV